jgi:hypothetical protein
MRGGENELGLGNLVQDAALIGTGAYLARQNPDSSILGVVGTAAKYFAYAIAGLVLFFLIFFLFAMIFGKRTAPPPADTTNAASGTPPPKK